MKILNYVFVIVLACVVAFTTARYAVPTKDVSGVEVTQKETRWEKIKKRGTLRCGYFLWPPVQVKDPNTGKMGGSIPAIVEEMAKQMNLKVDWVEEVDFAHMLSGYDRYDMICSPLTQNGARARETAFTMPLGYGGMYLFSRKDDHRFDADIMKINDPSVRITTLDGEYSTIIAAEDFPKAQTVPLGQLGAGAQMMLQVSSGKADIAITDLFSAQTFIESNQDKVKLVSDNPVRVFSFSFALAPDDFALKEAMNAALSNLSEIGFLNRSFKTSERGIAKLLRLATPYKE